MQDTESEANSMLFLNQNVLQEYQNRQREVQQFYKCTEFESIVSFTCIVAPYFSCSASVCLIRNRKYLAGFVKLE